ncbi:MAG TPA: class I SAM-dependent methyltransferase, partial [Candidatus Paenibacillus intestinavium]|nr:class I SAM-dependent methyltransferase [Candidatus Paenibacillus intestinavium]
LEDNLVEADFFSQYKVSYLKYEKWRSGELIQTELQRLALRWYGIEEFKLILESIGFLDVVVSADFEYGKAPTHSKQTFIYEATRK